MTDDIVARLRTWSADESTWDLLTEAADEITRLQADNKHLEKMWLSVVETLRRNAQKNAAQVAALAGRKTNDAAT